LIIAALVTPILIAAVLVATVLVATIPTAVAAAPVLPAFPRIAGLRRRRRLLGLLGLGRRPGAAVPVGTTTAIAPVAAFPARLTPGAAIAAARRLLLRLSLGRLSLGLLLLLLLPLTPAAALGAAFAATIRAVLPGAGGFRRGPAQQRQDHRRRDQTFHVFPSAPRGLVLTPSLIPCIEVSALLHEPCLNDSAYPRLSKKGDPP
jgi:hypothetical protein